MGRLSISGVIVALLLSVTGCSRSGRTSILVGAASSLRPPLEEVIMRYSRSRPSVEVVVSYAGSGTIRRQIEFGAPIDVFLSASPEHIDSLFARRLLREGTRRIIASNSLVLVAPLQRAPLSGPGDLMLPVVSRIAIGDPAIVPAGRYAFQSLEHLGMLSAIREKLVYTKDVAQALTYVEAGVVDAGFVYLSDVNTRPTVRLVSFIGDSLHDPLSYEAALTTSSTHPDEAHLFLAYLESDSTRDLLLSKGFRRQSQ